MARRFLAKDVPYGGTTISAEQTQMEIGMMLKEYGVVAMRWTDTPESLKGVELPVLEFVVNTEVKGVRKEIGIQVKPVLLTQKVGKRYNKRTTGAPEQSMRLLFWWLKSRLEAAKFGLESIEKTMLSKVIMNLPDGTTTTVGEAVVEQLALPTQSPNLLPEFDIKKPKAVRRVPVGAKEE